MFLQVSCKRFLSRSEKKQLKFENEPADFFQAAA
jgi:hypothetical protein